MRRGAKRPEYYLRGQLSVQQPHQNHLSCPLLERCCCLQIRCVGSHVDILASLHDSPCCIHQESLAIFLSSRLTLSVYMHLESRKCDDQSVIGKVGLEHDHLEARLREGIRKHIRSVERRTRSKVHGHCHSPSFQPSLNLLDRNVVLFRSLECGAHREKRCIRL